MFPTPIVSDETDRLAALRAYGILDTEVDDAFDRFTRLAAAVAEAPIALISLVDAERVWFKSARGLGAVRQVPRDLAFCAWAIAQDEPLVVPDATRDSRFASNPLVTGSQAMRFYAGAQLVTPGGYNVGTLCAIGHEPRDLSQAQLGLMKDLAGAVVTTMELYRAVREMRALAMTDPLTQLSNRAHFRSVVGVALEESRVNRRPFSVVYFDCDNFKAVNDVHGHATGDRLLQTLAAHLRDELTGDDTPARLGGDEFAAVLPARDQREAVGLANGILQSAAALMEQHGWPVTLSIGVATFRTPPPSVDRAIAFADAAMYDAKRRGKRHVNAVVLDDPDQQANGRATSLYENLDRAMIGHQFRLFYQPIVSLTSGEVTGVEALIRWDHPELGLLGPAAFIPYAERTGLIQGIGAEVLDLALARMARWRDQPWAPRYVAVNVSGVQVSDPHFVEVVVAALRRHGVSPCHLELELTEGTLIDSTPEVVDRLRKLGQMGVKLAIDDFGVGYSSLRYLRTLPVHKLKIDQSFVREVTENPRDATIVGAVVALARALGLQTVAEGVERPEQLGRLRELGCDLGQGWLFGHPAAEPDFGRSDAAQLEPLTWAI